MVILHLKLNAILKCSSSKYFARNPKPLTLGVKNNFFFQNNFMLHVKLKGITNAATWSQIFCCRLPPTLTLGLGSNGQNSSLSEHGHVANQIKANHECIDMVANICQQIPLPHDPRDGVNTSKFNFFRTWSCCTLK